MVHSILPRFFSVVDLATGLFSEASMSVIENLPLETLVVGTYICATGTHIGC
jgi:hypothetical protein